MLTPASFRKGRAHAPRISEPYVPGKRNRRYWTEAEIDIVRQNYPVHGAGYCLALLPAKSDRSVYALASKLRLRAPNYQGKRTVVGDRYDEQIKAAWPGLAGRGALTRLADELGIRRQTVSQRALKLGLSMPHRKESPWTEAEDALLRRAPVNNPEAASKFFAAHGFRRTEAAIVVRCKRLSVTRRRTDVYSARAAARVLGVDGKTVTVWCLEGLIRADRRGTDRLPQQGGDTWTIAPAELRRFILAEIDRLDIRKVEKHAFVALLAGGLDPEAAGA